MNDLDLDQLLQLAHDDRVSALGWYRRAVVALLEEVVDLRERVAALEDGR